MNKGKRILVVDDDLGILDSFDALFGEDHEMVSAQDGFQALEKLRKDSYELIFLDIRMPRIDGIEVLRQIRRQGSDARVVIITALPSEEYEDDVKDLGIAGCVRKPFDVAEVEKIVDRL